MNNALTQIHNCVFGSMHYYNPRKEKFKKLFTVKILSDYIFDKISLKQMDHFFCTVSFPFKEIVELNNVKIIF